jgi:hypothetical protein
MCVRVPLLGDSIPQMEAALLQTFTYMADKATFYFCDDLEGYLQTVSQREQEGECTSEQH